MNFLVMHDGLENVRGAKTRFSIVGIDLFWTSPVCDKPLQTGNELCGLHVWQQL